VLLETELPRVLVLEDNQQQANTPGDSHCTKQPSASPQRAASKDLSTPKLP